jgi:nucleoporin POM152
MSSTPRLRSGYPATPGTVNRRHQTPRTSASSSTLSTTRSPTLPLAPETAPADTKAPTPVIPLTILDAPSQRFYAIGLYAALFVWKLYDWLSVAEEGNGSWAMFLKWNVIDLVYLFGIPELRIPWLVWSQSFVTGFYVVHVILNWLLMFLVPVSKPTRHICMLPS